STAQASEAQEARIARFSWTVISGSLTTSMGVRKAPVDGGDGLDQSPFGSRFAWPHPSKSDMGRRWAGKPRNRPRSGTCRRTDLANWISVSRPLPKIFSEGVVRVSESFLRRKNDF